MTYNVLFLCTGNSARSIMAEAPLNYWGHGRFHAFSAGSQPKGEVHPLTLETLERTHLPVEGTRSKSRSEFSGAGETAGWPTRGVSCPRRAGGSPPA
jgi:arsenate reductase